MHLTDDGVTKFRLGVVDGMTAHDCDAGLAHLVGAAGNNLLQQSGAELLARERCDVEREERARTYRVDVADGVRRGDGPEVRRVIDDWREEVNRRDERAIGRDSID